MVMGSTSLAWCNDKDETLKSGMSVLDKDAFYKNKILALYVFECFNLTEKGKQIINIKECGSKILLSPVVSLMFKSIS